MEVSLVRGMNAYCCCLVSSNPLHHCGLLAGFLVALVNHMSKPVDRISTGGHETGCVTCELSSDKAFNLSEL